MTTRANVNKGMHSTLGKFQHKPRTKGLFIRHSLNIRLSHVRPNIFKNIVASIVSLLYDELLLIRRLVYTPILSTNTSFTTLLEANSNHSLFDYKNKTKRASIAN
jgi:type III secretory pathway lipoprotein EscJ